MEAAVSITVCSTTVIIPAILRALGVGDPFMREDTVDPQYSTGIEIAGMTSTRIELSLPISRGTGTTDSTKLEGAIDTVVSRKQHSVDSDVRDDRKFRLVTQISCGSLGELKPTNVALPITGSDVASPLCFPVVKKDRDIEADVGER